MIALVYLTAALAEIAGCFAVWAVVRLGAPGWWLLPGFASLAAFAYLLTLVDAPAAGRVFAAYGGVYIVASIVWLRVVEEFQPDRFDLIGGAFSLAGAVIIILAPRGG